MKNTKSVLTLTKSLFVPFLFLVLAPNALAVSAENFEYNGYMRTGVGSNLKGGDMNCYHQANVPGNEFRLGNECSIYGENLLRAYTNSALKDQGEFYRANFGFSYAPNGKNMGEPPNFYVYSAYIEAGRLDDSEAVTWVGKRFYRDGDLHIDDFFYFADTSGSGAGIERIKLFNAHLALAMMFEDTDSTNGLTTVVNGVTVPVNKPITTTQIGEPRTILLDARLFDLVIADHQKLNLWGGIATSSGGTDTVTHITYGDSTGLVGGVKHIYDLGNNGYARTSVLYGSGLMQGLNLGGQFGTDPTQTQGHSFDQSARRWRLVEDLMWQPSSKFAAALGAVYENWNFNSPNGVNGQWASLGIRPIYFFTDHYSLVFDAGASSVRQAGSFTGAVPMYRVTIAPQISPKPQFYARPVLRAFLTRTFTQGSPTELLSTNTSFGFQGEVWF